LAESPVMNWLHDRVPITLICDLVSLADPDSEAINRAERPDRDPIWIEVAEHAEAAEAASAQGEGSQAASA
jgi:hypothetical protein